MEEFKSFVDVEKSKEHVRGHRSRLKNRFRERGAAALADYELLELLLFRSIPRRDTKPLAKRLLQEYGSIAEVLSARPERLREIRGLGDATITDFLVIKAAAEALLSGNVKEETSFKLMVCRDGLLPRQNGI